MSSPNIIQTLFLGKTKVTLVDGSIDFAGVSLHTDKANMPNSVLLDTSDKEEISATTTDLQLQIQTLAMKAQADEASIATLKQEVKDLQIQMNLLSSFFFQESSTDFTSASFPTFSTTTP